MKIHQIAVFMENKPGNLQTICRTLADAGINITTLSLADTAQYGILRLLIKDWEKAQKTLTDAGFVVNINQVLAVEVPDAPGGLAALLDAVAQAGANIEYMYAFTHHKGSNAVMVFRFSDPDKAEAALAAKNVNVLADADIFTK